jgi:hypothetical protein
MEEQTKKSLRNGAETLKDKCIRNTHEIIQKFGDKLSVRQIFYQLVSHYGLVNTRSKYTWCDSVLVEARKQGEISYDVIEDRTRTFKLYCNQRDIPENLEKEVDSSIDYCLECMAPKYAESDFQPVLHLIVCEKQALQSFIGSRISKKNTILVINKGYNSLSQLHEIAE